MADRAYAFSPEHLLATLAISVFSTKYRVLLSLTIEPICSVSLLLSLLVSSRLVIRRKRGEEARPPRHTEALTSFSLRRYPSVFSSLASSLVGRRRHRDRHRISLVENGDFHLQVVRCPSL